MSNTWSRWEILTDAMERRLRDLPEPDLCQVALMKLEGHTNREVAETLACSERSAERKLNSICKRWEAGGERAEDERPWEATP
jgi:DNA-directed RNA polymerase specialized sigma24 family protein